MQRKDLEHLIRAAAAVTDQYELVVVGSQSILGAHPNAPKFLLRSREADMFPLHRPDLADVIDGAIGELSAFDDTFGYYAQGVGPETALLPEGWQSRLVKVQNENTNLKIGYCLDPHDLAASKLIAGRPKDWEFVGCMVEHELVDVKVLQTRVLAVATAERRIQIASEWLKSRTKQGEDAKPAPKTKKNDDAFPVP